MDNKRHRAICFAGFCLSSQQLTMAIMAICYAQPCRTLLHPLVFIIAGCALAGLDPLDKTIRRCCPSTRFPIAGFIRSCILLVAITCVYTAAVMANLAVFSAHTNNTAAQKGGAMCDFFGRYPEEATTDLTDPTSYHKPPMQHR